MKCSLCRKSSSKLVTYRLCKCCSERAQVGCRESIFFVSNEVRNEEADDAVRKVECDVCQEPIRKDGLEQHRETCFQSRVVFRCTVCHVDYQHKAGLWEHLDEHEIEDEAKEHSCGETNVMYELHKCALCDDHRVYREKLYWNHVHEDHDGYFLKCFYCQETFRSRKLQIDHDENHCKVRAKAVDDSDCGKSSPSHEFLVEDDDNHYKTQELTIEYARSEDSPNPQDEKQFSPATLVKPKRSLPGGKRCPDCGLGIQKRKGLGPHHCRVEEKAQDVTPMFVRKQCPECGREFRKLTTFAKHKCEGKVKPGNSSDTTESLGSKENDPKEQATSKLQCPHCKRLYINHQSLKVHIRSLHKKARCTICGLVLANYGLVKSHRIAVHTERPECPHCKQKFSKKNFQNHLNSHQEASHLCSECGMMFKSGQNLQVHLRRFHTPGKTPRMKRYIRHRNSRNRVVNVDEIKADNSESQQEGA